MKCPRPNTPDLWKPRRSKPRSIMRSKMMSVKKLVNALSLALGILSMQMASAGAHAGPI